MKLKVAAIAVVLALTAACSGGDDEDTPVSGETSSRFPVKFTYEDMTFRAPEGWTESAGELPNNRLYQVEAADGTAVAWIDKYDAEDDLDVIVSSYLNTINAEVGFPEEGIGRGAPESIDIAGVGAARLARMHNVETALTEPGVVAVDGALVVARDGDTNYFLFAAATPEGATSEALVDDLVQTLRIE